MKGEERRLRRKAFANKAVMIFTKRHEVVRAKEEEDNLYTSIDRVSDVLTRKLCKIKEEDGGHGRTRQMRKTPRVGELLSNEVDNLMPILERKPSELPDEMAEEIDAQQKLAVVGGVSLSLQWESCSGKVEQCI